MAALQGWQGRVTLSRFGADLNLPVTRWQVSWQSEKVDITNAEDSYKTQQSNLNYLYLRIWMESYATVQCNFDCLWDTSITPFDSVNGVALYPGRLVELTFYSVAGQDTGSCVLPNCILDTVSVESEVRGVIKYNVTGTLAKMPGGLDFFF